MTASSVSAERASSGLSDRVCLTAMVIAVLAPFWRMALALGLPVPDDFGNADFFEAEYAVRVAMGRMLRAGELPVWITDVLGGMPSAGGMDPLSMVSFGLLPPVLAVNVVLLGALLIAATGAYALGRRRGLSPWACALSGFSFAGSGYLVCQIRHVGILTTVCWAPWTLAVLSGVMDRASSRQRAARGALAFAAVWGAQLAAGFPQSAYICAFAYGALGLVWASVLDRRDAVERLAWLSLAVVVGVLLAAYQIAPMWELAGLSTRIGRGFEWSAQYAYHPFALWTFVTPYRFGDASHADYAGGIFWEEYGYVGLAPLALGAYALVRRRERWVVALLVVAALALLLVMGNNTPAYEWAFRWVPGMSLFRLPTRFLVVTDLMLCVLGGVGLSALLDDLGARDLGRWRRAVGPGVFLFAVANLWWVQARQIPIGDARAWMRPPVTAQAILREPGLHRTFSLGPHRAHMEAATEAHGWQDLRPLLAVRDILVPDSNLLWGVSVVGGYSGLYTRWTSALWGGHSERPGLVTRTLAGGAISPAFFRLLAMFNVRYLLLKGTVDAPELTRVPVATASEVSLYRLRETLPRAWWVARATVLASPSAAAERILAADFDPRAEVILHAPGLAASPSSAASRGVVRVRSYRPRDVTLDVQADAPGWLVLSDSYYPGWEVTIDGRPGEIERANINARAVRLAAGEHRVAMTFTAPAFWLGLRLSGVGLVLLALGRWMTRRMRAAPGV